MKRCAVIMAGGSGERFWPLSRKRKPKQLLKLTSSGKTMLEEAIERVAGIIEPEDTFIITGELLLEPIRAVLPSLPPENVIAEPHKRNTAPCLALAASFISAKYEPFGLKPNEISIAVLTADQDIKPTEKFRSAVTEALNFVEDNEFICTIGIPPMRPETGYGYIELAETIKCENDIEIARVARFREKPDCKQAIDFLKSGRFLWNSGMFFWRLDIFINELAQHLPEVGQRIADMQAKYSGKTNIPLPEPLSSISELFKNFPNESIDYGLMEKAQKVAVLKAPFLWDDIGSWDSLSRIKPSDDKGNIIEGLTAVIDTSDSIIINSSEKGKIVVAALGLNDITVVATDDAILVCPKNRVQEVKKCVEAIRASNMEKWL